MVKVPLWLAFLACTVVSFGFGVMVQATQHFMPCMGDCGCRDHHHGSSDDVDDAEEKPVVTPGPEV